MLRAIVALFTANIVRPDTEESPVNAIIKQGLGKVPEVTLGFWLIKIAATTLGETGGDSVTMSMNLGYLVGSAIFATIFVVAVAAQSGPNAFTRICSGR